MLHSAAGLTTRHGTNTKLRQTLERKFQNLASDPRFFFFLLRSTCTASIRWSWSLKFKTYSREVNTSVSYHLEGHLAVSFSIIIKTLLCDYKNKFCQKERDPQNSICSLSDPPVCSGLANQQFCFILNRKWCWRTLRGGVWLLPLAQKNTASRAERETEFLQPKCVVRLLSSVTESIYHCLHAQAFGPVFA